MLAVSFAYLATEAPFSFSLIDAECEGAQQQYYHSRERVLGHQDQVPPQEEKARNEAHDHADVCAQYGMAKAAERGLWALYFTLAFTAAAAVAAWVAVRTMKETAERQLRAYVFVRNTKIMNLGGTGDITIGYEIKNYGQTPAYRVTCVSDAFIADYPFTGRIALGSIVPVPISDLGPGAYMTRTQSLNPPTEETLNAIRARTKAIYLQGRITFVDSFGADRSLEFLRAKRTLDGESMTIVRDEAT